VVTYRMPRFYSKYLNKTLQDYVEEQLAVSPREQLQLFEELAVARTMASKAARLYSASVGTDSEDTGIMVMRDALEFVVDVCTKAAAIEASSKDKLSVHNLVHAVNQITRIIYDVLGGTNDGLAEEIERRIRKELRVETDNEQDDLVDVMDPAILAGMSLSAKRELLCAIRGGKDKPKGENGKNGNGRK